MANALQHEGRSTSYQSFLGCFGRTCTAHARIMLYTRFRSKFWQRHYIQRLRFPKE